jgi:hypothetical protein
VTWRGRIAREILTGAGYGALADSIIEVVDSTAWPEVGQQDPEAALAPSAPPAPPTKAPAVSAEYLTIK